MRDENGPHLDYMPQRVIEVMLDVAKTPVDERTFNVFICYSHSHEPIGFLMAEKSPCIFNHDWFGRQELWFVKEEHRGSRAAVKLTKAFEDWTKDTQINYMGVVRDEKDQAKKIGKLIERGGYTKVGTYYKKEKL